MTSLIVKEEKRDTWSLLVCFELNLWNKPWSLKRILFIHKVSIENNNKKGGRAFSEYIFFSGIPFETVVESWARAWCVWRMCGVPAIPPFAELFSSIDSLLGVRPFALVPENQQ